MPIGVGVVVQGIAVTANTILAGPTTGSAAVPTFRALVGADLPNPSASTLGGIQSIAAVGSKWINTISTSGVPNLTQPAFTDISGAATNADLPNGISNHNNTQQNTGQLVAATNVYITSSNINVPAAPVTGIAIGTTMTWRVTLTKNANGTGACSLVIFMGTNASIADTATVTQAITGTATAAVDTMQVDVQLMFTAVGAGTGSFYWSMSPSHQAATATGFGMTVTTGAFTGVVNSLTTTTANLKFGLGVQCATGGTMPTLFVPLVQANAYNLV